MGKTHAFSALDAAMAVQSSPRQGGHCRMKEQDDINMTDVEPQIDSYVKAVESMFGKCKVTKRNFVNCGVRHTKAPNGDVIMDQDDYIKTLRPITSHELTGAPADSPATKHVADLFVSLRGALAYTVLTQAWIQF